MNTLNYDLDEEKLRGILGDFYHATGVKIYFVTRKAIYSYEKNVSCIPCIRCEAELFEKSKLTGVRQMSFCKGGIINVVLPLVFSEEAIESYLFFSFRRQPTSVMDKCPFTRQDELPLPSGYYEDLQPYDKNKFEGVINIANTLCTQLIPSGVVFVNRISPMFQIKNFINENYNLPISVNDIAKAANVSKSNLYRIFKNDFECTPIEYLNKKRIEKAKELLIDTEFNVNEISVMLGFLSAACFRSVFKNECKVSPTSFRKKYIHPTDEQKERKKT